MHNNIWKIFYLLLLGTLIAVAIVLYSSYQNILQRHHSSIEHYVEIIANTISNDFSQKNMLLDIVGRQLLENNNYKNKIKTEKILDKLLKDSPYFVGFGLARIDGELIVTSTNIVIPEGMNLLQNETSRYSFQKALDSKKMVIGRTSFFKPTDEWIIPIRKAIRDENGTVLGVMTAGIKNGKENSYFKKFKLSPEKNVIIIKDFDDKKKIYRQYYSNFETISNEEMYNVEVPIRILSAFSKELKEKYNISIEDLQKSSHVCSVEGMDAFGKEKIAAITYDKNHNLWIIVNINKSEVINEFYRVLAIYFVFFILSSSVIYYLFKYIAKSEDTKKRELHFQVEHDTLTQLPNRNYMYNHIDKWILQHKNQYDVFYLDLDNFKNVNDRFGHMIGDEILIEVASRLRRIFSDDDILIRQGGDEFIVLKQCKDNSIKNNRLQMLIDDITRPYIIENKEYRIGLSVGISSYPVDGTDLQDLLRFSDIAMYEAKKIKNSYCFFSQEMNHAISLKSDIEQELRGAMQRKEFWMVYQPQINADGSLHGVEALIRWKNEKLGMVGPDRFITVAEEIGMMKELGLFIIYESLNSIHNLQNKMHKKFKLSINISVVQFMESSFINDVLKAIDEVGISKALITLEITETLSIEDLDVVIPILHAIRDVGIEVSLDDFGTGYSSLSILKKLPISELKIDKSFVDDILHDKSAKALVSSIINIGKNFSMKTLAEGVESLEQVNELKEFSCDIFQGYYFSKPLSIEDLQIYINKGNFDNDK